MLVWMLAAALIAETLVIATLAISISETKRRDRPQLPPEPTLTAEASEGMEFPPIQLPPVSPIFLTMPDGSIRDQVDTGWPLPWR